MFRSNLSFSMSQCNIHKDCYGSCRADVSDTWKSITDCEMELEVTNITTALLAMVSEQESVAQGGKLLIRNQVLSFQIYTE